jgi:hypothetical protein
VVILILHQILAIQTVCVHNGVDFLILEEVVCHWLLGGHAARVLRRSFKDSVAPAGAVEVSLRIVAEHGTQSSFAIWSGVGS